MEYKIVKALLEKYWESATSAEEEEALKAYFRQENIPADLQAYKPFFQYYDQQRALTLGDDFDEKIINKIKSRNNDNGRIRLIRIAVYSAAATLILFLGIYFSQQQNTKAELAKREDTYQDPQRALAEVQRALLLVSKKMNDGEQLATQKMQKLNTLNKVIDTDEAVSTPK